MSKKEEEVQRLIGTLPKYVVNVQKDIIIKSFANIYVTASDEDAAKKRARILINSTEKNIDDTFQPIAWAINQTGKDSTTVITGVHELKETDAQWQRFNKK